MLTLGSTTPGVCTKTTCCRNLTQHTRTPGGAESIRLRIFVLIADMSCHVVSSWALCTLVHASIRQGSTKGQSSVCKHWRVSLQCTMHS
jgi:hypothetical protein